VLSFWSCVATGVLLGVLSNHWAAAAVPHVTLVDVCCMQAREKAAMRWVVVAAVWAATLVESHKNGSLETLQTAVTGILVASSRLSLVCSTCVGTWDNGSEANICAHLYRLI
jgi:hypothetical protein